MQDIQKVYLTGAFGTFMDPVSACRIGLLPAVLESKITAAGNAAGSGAKLLACCDQALYMAQELIKQVEFIELASVSDFQGRFARNMRFDVPESYWCQKAVSLGFSKAVPMDMNTLRPRQDVRDMCTADKCGAYGKNWTCPPYCGTLDECTKKIQQYSRGILLQTVGITEKTIDTKAYRRTETRHLEQFHQLCEEFRKVYPHALCLGSGGCRICGKCAFPESCRSRKKPALPWRVTACLSRKSAAAMSCPIIMANAPSPIPLVFFFDPQQFPNILDKNFSIAYTIYVNTFTKEILCPKSSKIWKAS